MRNAVRHFVAEFVGVFAYVFLGGAAIAMIRYTNGRVGLLEVAAAHGLIFAAMVSATMRISGHLNPAITVGMLATRRIEPMMAGVYVLAQVFGAIVASYALRGLIPADVFTAIRGGGQAIALDVSFVQAFFLEFVATFILVFTVFGTAVDPQAPKVGGLAIGFALAAGMLGIGPLTGGSLNPARSFGPAIASGVFEGQAVYWLGPIAGAVAAAFLYDLLFLPRGRESDDSGALLPADEGTGRTRTASGKRHG
jgi:MIP family channel proteins